MSTYRAWGMDSERALNWRDRAACNDYDADMWVLADKRDRLGTQANWQALRICASCPVARTCLNWALATQAHGMIYGGIPFGDGVITRPVECERKRCRNQWVGEHPRKKYCSDACRSADHQERAAVSA